MTTKLRIPHGKVDTLTAIGDRSLSVSAVMKGFRNLGLDMFGDHDNVARQLDEDVSQGFLIKSFTLLGFRYAIAPEVLAMVANPNSRVDWWHLSKRHSLEESSDNGEEIIIVNPQGSLR